MMRSLAILSCLLVAVGAFADAKPRIRLEVSHDALLVGREFRIGVTIQVPNFFLGAPQFPTLESPDAVIRLLDEHATLTTETIDGVSYSGIQKSYAVTALRPGKLELPGGSITCQYAAVPGQPAVSATVALPVKAFDIVIAPGAARSSGVVSRVEVTQVFDPEATEPRVGDALTRTVTIVAPNMQPMLIPPIAFDAPPGVRVYGHDPVLSDVTGAHDEFLGGRRVDSATYVFLQEGDVTLPEIDVPWFDVATSKSEVARAPALVLHVANAPNEPAIVPTLPATEAERASEPSPASSVAIASVVGSVLLLGVVWLWRRYQAPVATWIAARQRLHAESEATRYAELRRACGANDAGEAYRAAARWAHARAATLASLRVE